MKKKQCFIWRYKPINFAQKLWNHEDHVRDNIFKKLPRSSWTYHAFRRSHTRASPIPPLIPPAPATTRASPIPPLIPPATLIPPPTQARAQNKHHTPFSDQFSDYLNNALFTGESFLWAKHDFWIHTRQICLVFRPLATPPNVLSLDGHDVSSETPLIKLLFLRLLNT